MMQLRKKSGDENLQYVSKVKDLLDVWTPAVI